MATAKRLVALGIPTHDTMMADTALCLAGLTARVGRHTSDDLVVVARKGTMLADMRNSIAGDALARGASHILWIDSDMTFPADALERLLAHEKPIVGCNYPSRLRPVEPTAVSLAGERIYEGEGLGAVRSMGLGLCLMETAVFRSAAFPWFYSDWNVGEDGYFFLNAPCPAWVDHDLSQEIGHVGYHRYTHEDAMRDREAARMNSMDAA